jgi:hypothetical protein
MDRWKRNAKPHCYVVVYCIHFGCFRVNFNEINNDRVFAGYGKATYDKLSDPRIYSVYIFRARKVKIMYTVKSWWEVVVLLLLCVLGIVALIYLRIDIVGDQKQEIEKLLADEYKIDEQEILLIDKSSGYEVILGDKGHYYMEFERKDDGSYKIAKKLDYALVKGSLK